MLIDYKVGFVSNPLIIKYSVGRNVASNARLAEEYIEHFFDIVGKKIYDYSNKRKYYNKVIKKLEKLNDKYMLPDVIEEDSFLESKIFYNVIEEMGKSMKDKVSEVKRETYDYREYIELWIHEVKTPIAACKLLVENNKNDVTKKSLFFILLNSLLISSLISFLGFPAS